jgi:hypothetical protein
MKALSIRSPYWELILSGKKTIETRTWKTNYRGDFLICATQPHGQAVAIVELVECRPMQPDDWKKACCPKYANAWALVLKNVRPIKQFPVCGKLSFYEVEIDEKNLSPGN